MVLLRSLTTAFRYFHEIQFKQEVDELLYLLTALLNSLLEKDIHIDVSFNGISSKTSGFICSFGLNWMFSRALARGYLF